jgi:hypothetical protein
MLWPLWSQAAFSVLCLCSGGLFLNIAEVQKSSYWRRTSGEFVLFLLFLKHISLERVLRHYCLYEHKSTYTDICVASPTYI